MQSYELYLSLIETVLAILSISLSISEIDSAKAYNRFQWTDLLLENHEHLVPRETPPFIMIDITNGLKTKRLAHLQEGVRKEAYGNVLDKIDEVKAYCDSFSFMDQEWKLGSPSVCSWKPGDLNATFAVDVTCNGKKFVSGKSYFPIICKCIQLIMLPGLITVIEIHSEAGEIGGISILHL